MAPVDGQDASSRSVMIRDWYWVPAVPTQTLREVFGERRPDGAVEFVALTVEYYVNAHASAFLTHDRVLEAMRGRVTGANVYDLISLLAKRGVVEQFFDLTRTDVDSGGDFRRFLLGLDPLLIEAIRHYSAWNAISPKLSRRRRAWRWRRDPNSELAQQARGRPRRTG